MRPVVLLKKRVGPKIISIFWTLGSTLEGWLKRNLYLVWQPACDRLQDRVAYAWAALLRRRPLARVLADPDTSLLRVTDAAVVFERPVGKLGATVGDQFKSNDPQDEMPAGESHCVGRNGR